MPTHVSHARRGAAWSFAVLVLCFASVPRIAARAAAPRADAPPASADARTTATISDALPLAFEPNVGQTDARVRFIARGREYTTYFTDSAATLSIPSGRSSVRMTMVGAKTGARAVAGAPLPGRTNYLVGSTPDTWRTDVPTYASVRYEGVYDGVDAVFYGAQDRLEYDLVVAPGADVSAVRLKFDGQKAVRVDEDGALALELPGGELRQARALVYQEGSSGKRAVAARYAATADGEVRLEVGDYDRTRPLVVDPTLTYLDFVGGGTSRDTASAVAVDSAGNAYVTGMTNASNFPVTPGAFDTTLEPNNFSPFDAFVVKLNPQGTQVLYGTYLGGFGLDDPRAIAIDGSGNAYVAGVTDSTNFPTTAGAYDRTLAGNGTDAFVTKLNASGTALVYSTYLGGSGREEAHAIRVASNGGAVVVGLTESNDYPVTPGAYDTTHDIGGVTASDVFVTRLSPNGGSLVFSTFVGGSGSEEANGVALDTSANVYVAGFTTSQNFPTTAGAYDTTVDVNGGAFALKLAASGASLSYSTFLGSGRALGLALDASANAYVVGIAGTGYPTTSGAFTTGPADGFGDGFVTKVNPSGSALVYSSVIGVQTNYDQFNAVALDAAGDVFVAGRTDSAAFPTTPGAFDTTSRNTEGVALELNTSGSALVYSTFVGGSYIDSATGIGVDGSGRAYVVGLAYSADFPTTPGALDPTPNGNQDAFVVRIDPGGGAGFSTMLAGTASDYDTWPDPARAVSVDAAGAAYVVGSTSSLTFPTTPGAWDVTFPLDRFGDTTSQAYVSKISPDGSTLEYSTFLGGGGEETAYGVAVGVGGAVYVVGVTESADFPTTPGAFDRTYGGDSVGQDDGFLAELAPDGGSLIYSTFLGGDYDDEARGVALGADGTAYVTGDTESPNFPTTPGAFDTVFGNTPRVADAFLARVSADGSSLVYSTFLGGAEDDFGNGVAVDAAGSAYVVGETQSGDFPTTPGAFDAVFAADDTDFDEGFVTKVSPAGDVLAYSSFVGGDHNDVANAVAVDGQGDAFVAGATGSANFPVTPGAYDTTFAGADAFVVKVAPAGTSLAYATFLGTAGADACYGIAVTAAGEAYVTGDTTSVDFPTTPDAIDTANESPNPGQEARDGFVTGISADGASLVYSTLLGGTKREVGRAIARDPDGSVVAVGESESPEFATSSGFGYHDGANAWVARFRVAGPGHDTVGVYTPSTGAWFLRNANSPGAADALFAYGPAGAGWLPLRGDWNGDGVDSPGLYDPSTGTFFLENASGPGAADLVFSFGAGGSGVVPLAGDWNGDGVDTVGLYVSATGAFFLRNVNAPGNADVVFTFGAGGAGNVPLAGDWNGDGTDTVGLYVPATGAFFLRNANASGNADLVFTYGPANVTPVTGDFDGDGVDTVGVYSAASGTFFLKNANAPGPADLAFSYGPAGATPLVGDWDGQ